MKTKTAAKVLLAFASVLTLNATHVFAQPFLDAVWTIDENGSGLFNALDPGSTSGVTSQNIVGYSVGHLQADPVSGIVGLYYKFGTVSLPGDVVLLEPQAPTGTPSDMLRFDGQGGVYFFSDYEPGEANTDLADVPVMPQPINPVFINEVGPEGNNGALYSPVAGQPGFDTSGILPGLQYNIISDVPEPASVALLLAGPGLWLFRVLHRRKS